MDFADELRILKYTIYSASLLLNKANKFLYKVNRDLNEGGKRTEGLPDDFDSKLEKQLKSLSEHADWLRLNGPIILEEARVGDPKDGTLKLKYRTALDNRKEELQTQIRACDSRKEIVGQ